MDPVSMEAEMRAADEAAEKAQAAAVEAVDKNAGDSGAAGVAATDDGGDAAAAVVGDAMGKKKPAAARRHGRKVMTEEEINQRHAEQAAAQAKARADAKPAGPTQSKFADLTSKLADAAAIADHVRQNVKELSSSDRDLNAIFQLVSSRDSSVCYRLIDEHRAETLWLLERLSGGTFLARARSAPPAALANGPAASGAASKSAGKKAGKKGAKGASGGSAAATAVLDLSYAHEFAIRVLTSPVIRDAAAAAEGAQGTYEDDVAAVSESVPLPVLGAVEMADEFVTADPEGHVFRWIQLSTTAADVKRCAKRLLRFAAATRGEGASANEADGTSATERRISDASASALLARLMSKARNVATIPKASTSAAAAAPPAEEKKEDDEDAAAPSSSKATVDVESGTLAVASVLKTADRLCLKGPVAVPPKAQHFLDWVADNELIGEDDLLLLEALLNAITQGVEDQAKGMEAVLMLKAASTRAELRDALNLVSSDAAKQAADDDDGSAAAASGSRPVLTLATPDVLSALGVAGSTLRSALKGEPSTEGESLCTDILDLLKTFPQCAPAGATLPRRAQRFIDDEARRARQLDPKRPRRADEEEDDEGEAGDDDADELDDQPARQQPAPADKL